jgi:hypothetical protein
MAMPIVGRRRPKVTATLDPDLLAAVDAYLLRYPGLDRSAILDDALRLWRARELERAMEAQFTEPDGLPAEERQGWQTLRRDAVARHMLPSPRS